MKLETVKENTLKMSNEGLADESPASEFRPMASTGTSKFLHVSNKSNSVLRGVSRNKQLIVMSIAKYDPKLKQEESGRKLIRVFGRSYNTLAFVPNAVSSQAYSIKTTFACNSGNFLHITDTHPLKNGTSTVTCTAKITYRVITDLDRTTSISTGIASFDHTVNGK